MVSFENIVKSMPTSLSEWKVTPSFCFPFKISDNPTASKVYLPVTLSQTQPIRQYSLSQELPEFTPSPLLAESFSAVWSSKWRKLTPRVFKALWTFFKFLAVLVLLFPSEVPKIWEIWFAYLLWNQKDVKSNKIIFKSII